MPESKLKAYEVGVYENDGGFRGYVADKKTSLNIFRTGIESSPEKAKKALKPRITAYKKQGIVLFYQDGFSSL